MMQTLRSSATEPPARTTPIDVAPSRTADLVRRPPTSPVTHRDSDFERDAPPDRRIRAGHEFRVSIRWM